MTQSHLFHPDAPFPAMQRDMEHWPIIREPWGDLRDAVCVGFAVMEPDRAAMLLKRQTKYGPHRWHICWVAALGFYASGAGWCDVDGLALRPGDDRRPQSPVVHPSSLIIHH